MYVFLPFFLRNFKNETEFQDVQPNFNGLKHNYNFPTAQITILPMRIFKTIKLKF